jgi:hypothetical protein
MKSRARCAGDAKHMIGMPVARRVQYHVQPATDDLSIILCGRKGILPEADFLPSDSLRSAGNLQCRSNPFADRLSGAERLLRCSV